MSTYILSIHVFVVVSLLTYECAAGSEHQDSLQERERDRPVLRVTSILGIPYLNFAPGSSGEFEGFIEDMLDDLARRVVFDYEIRPVRDGKYGSRLPNGSWNGMIGELIRGEADLAAAPLTVSSLRMRVVDFTYPYMTTYIAVIMKKRHSTQAEIHSPRDLARQSTIRFGVIGGGSTEHYLRTSMDPDYERIWEEIRRNADTVRSVDEGIGRMLESSDEYPWAFIGYSAQLSYYAGQRCDLDVFVDEYSGRGYALALPIGSDYFHRLNFAVLDMIESGRMATLRRRWWGQCRNATQQP